MRVVAVLLVPQGQGEARLRVIGPQPAVVVYPEPSQVALQIAVKSEAEMRRLTAPKLPQVEGLGLELGQPRTSQQSFFDGRRMTQTFSVSWVIDIRPKRVGDRTVEYHHERRAQTQVRTVRQLTALSGKEHVNGNDDAEKRRDEERDRGCTRADDSAHVDFPRFLEAVASRYSARIVARALAGLT